MKTERDSHTTLHTAPGNKRSKTSVRAGEVGAVATAVDYWKDRGYSQDTLGDGMVANGMYTGAW